MLKNFENWSNKHFRSFHTKSMGVWADIDDGLVIFLT